MPLAASKRHSRYYPYIDGLRALAVLSVFVYHLHGPWLPGGFVGVDVFFVISGFIVSASMAGFGDLGFRRFIGLFYARRIRRIVPALLVCLLITAGLSALFIPPSWLSGGNEKTGIFAALGLSNFILVQNGRDYFAPTAEFNPYTHTWSLAVEEQFYLVFPAMFFGWLAGGRRRRLSIALFVAAGLASLGWSTWQSWNNPLTAYFLTPSRFWELAAGVLLFQLISRRPAQDDPGTGTHPLRAVVGCLSLVLLLVSFGVSSPTRFPIPDVLLSVLGTLGVIWSLHGHDELRRLHAILGSRPLVAIGRISYSLYLWHWPVFVLFRWTCGIETMPQKLSAAVLAFLLAYASWRYVENPIRYTPWLKRVPTYGVMAAGLAAILCTIGVERLLAQRVDRISLSVVMRDRQAWFPHEKASSPDHPGCTADPQKVDIGGDTLLSFTPRGCKKPAELSKRTIYAIGDSHALAYHQMFQLYAIREAMPVQLYGNGGCPFLSLQPGRDVENPQCRPHIDAALRDMRTRIKPGDVLFLPSLRLPRLSDQWAYFGEQAAVRSVSDPSIIKDRQRAVANAVQTLREFSERGVIIIFEAPKPVFKAPPFRCSDWFNGENPICAGGLTMPRATLDYYRQPVLQALDEIARQVPGVSIWDPYPVLCPQSECRTWRDGKPLFLDGDHISGHANALLLPSFTEAVQSRLNSAHAAR